MNIQPVRLLTLNEVVAANVKTLRNKADLNQTQLAKYMDVYGFRWTKYTVQQVEKAQRRIQLDELAGLAFIFEQTITALMTPPELPSGTAIGIGAMTFDRTNFILDFFVSPQTALGEPRERLPIPDPHSLKRPRPELARGAARLFKEQESNHGEHP